MAEQTLTIGHGTSFEFGNADGPPETFTPLDGVTSVSFTGDKTETVDNTEMRTSGNTRQYQGGMRDPGSVTVKANIRPGNTSQTTFKNFEDASLHNFKVIYPNNVKTRAFAGIVESCDEEIDDAKKPIYNIKVKVSGPITDTYGS